MENITVDISAAVEIIKSAILQSQIKAVKAVNQEQLALYYGIGRYMSYNTRNKNWGKGVIDSISEQLKKELPGLRVFSERNIKNMRTFYEEWKCLENGDTNSAVPTAEMEHQSHNSAVPTAKLQV